MNRINTLMVTALAITALSGCRKNDWVNIPNGRDKCDYISASSTALDPDGLVSRPLFIKTYKTGTFKLEHLQMLRNAPIPQFESSLQFDITYKGQDMYLVQGGNDTTRIVFDLTGKPAKAFSALAPNEEWTESKFIYNNAGKLVEIKQRELESGNPAWYSFAKLTYDAGKKNLSKIEFLNLAGAFETHTFTYNYSRKVKRQYYPDQVTAVGSGFWSLLTILHLFPELEPENLLTSWHYQTSPDTYPPSIDAVYKNQVFDGTGKLVSYNAETTMFGNTGTSPWTIDWSCMDKK